MLAMFIKTNCTGSYKAFAKILCIVQYEDGNGKLLQTNCTHPFTIKCKQSFKQRVVWLQGTESSKSTAKCEE